MCNISSPAPGQHLNDSSIDLRYGLEHFGLRVDDIEVVIAKMKQAGVPILQDIKKTTSGNRIAFVHGPDNVMIELSQYHAGFKSQDYYVDGVLLIWFGVLIPPESTKDIAV